MRIVIFLAGFIAGLAALFLARCVAVYIAVIGREEVDFGRPWTVLDGGKA